MSSIYISIRHNHYLVIAQLGGIELSPLTPNPSAVISAWISVFL
jgi:hypothetical protein